ncbi:MAG: hypothetical protein JSU58_10540, partial [Dehalococcoidales bacterium]
STLTCKHVKELIGNASEDLILSTRENHELHLRVQTNGVVMSYNRDPHYIVPSDSLKSYADGVFLREEKDALLGTELGLIGRIVGVNNPLYCRKIHSETWIRIGESEDKSGNFSIGWDTTVLENGQYEIMSLMHVYMEKRRGEKRKTITRENVVEVTIIN